MNPQCERILRYLDEHGSITQMEANKLSIARLASRICALRQNGVEITDDWEIGTNQYGEPVHYKRYYKKQEPPALEADGSGAGG